MISVNGSGDPVGKTTRNGCRSNATNGSTPVDTVHYNIYVYLYTECVKTCVWGAAIVLLFFTRFPLKTAAAVSGAEARGRNTPVFKNPCPGQDLVGRYRVQFKLLGKTVVDDEEEEEEREEDEKEKKKEEEEEEAMAIAVCCGFCSRQVDNWFRRTGITQFLYLTRLNIISTTITD